MAVSATQLLNRIRSPQTIRFLHRCLWHRCMRCLFSLPFVGLVGGGGLLVGGGIQVRFFHLGLGVSHLFLLYLLGIGLCEES